METAIFLKSHLKSYLFHLEEAALSALKSSKLPSGTLLTCSVAKRTFRSQVSSASARCGSPARISQWNWRIINMARMANGSERNLDLILCLRRLERWFMDILAFHCTAACWAHSRFHISRDPSSFILQLTHPLRLTFGTDCKMYSGNAWNNAALRERWVSQRGRVFIPCFIPFLRHVSLLLSDSWGAWFIPPPQLMERHIVVSFLLCNYGRGIVDSSFTTRGVAYLCRVPCSKHILQSHGHLKNGASDIYLDIST